MYFAFLIYKGFTRGFLDNGIQGPHLFQKSVFSLISLLSIPAILFTVSFSLLLGSAKGFPVPDDFGSHSVDGLVKVRLFQLALPNDNNAPSFRLQLTPNFLIPLLVPGNLSHPELCVGFRNRIILTVFVAMPEAAMHEDNSTIFGQYEVRLAGQALVVEPIPVTPAPQLGPHNLLRGRVPGADAGHVVGALGGGHSDKNVRYWVVTLNPSALASLTIPGIPSMDHWVLT